MSSSIKVHGFRKDYNSVALELRSEITIFSGIPAVGPLQGRQYTALWDTGATGTCITKRVVEELGLKPIGKANCSHPGGCEMRDRYLVSLVLPNKVGVQDISVVDVEQDGGIDVLIGMDIITMGDFVLTNARDKTHFSFRTPALGGVDFSMPHLYPSIGLPTPKPVRPSKNGRCPCGTGKKYKACCSPKFG